MQEYISVSLALGFMAVVFVYYMALAIQAGKDDKIGEWFVDIGIALISVSAIFYTFIKVNEVNTAMIIKAMG